MQSDLDIDVLVRQAVSGDRIAFEKLIKKYQNIVYGLAYNKLGNFHDAQDVVQEVFMKAYRDLKSLKTPQRFAGWLYVITSNCCKMWLRKHRKHLDLTEDWEDLDEKLVWRKSSEAYADESVRGWVHDAIDTLGADEGSLLRLFYISGLSYREIGEFLGVSANTVKSRLYTARQHLKGELEDKAGKVYAEKRLNYGFGASVMERISGTPILPVASPVLQMTHFISIGITATIIIIGLFFAVYGRRLAVDWGSPTPDGTVVGVWLAEGNSVRNNPQKRAIQTPRRGAIPPADEEIETFSTTGVVLQQNNPAKGVTVYAYQTRVIVGQTVTDEEGKFHFDQLPKKDDFRGYYLIASVPNQWLEWHALETERPELNALEITLRRTGIVRGKVLDLITGQPIAGGRIKILVGSVSSDRESR